MLKTLWRLPGGLGLAALQLVASARAAAMGTAGTSIKRSHLRAAGLSNVASSRSTEFVEILQQCTAGPRPTPTVVLNTLTSPGARETNCYRRDYLMCSVNFCLLSLCKVWGPCLLSGLDAPNITAVSAVSKLHVYVTFLGGHWSSYGTLYGVEPKRVGLSAWAMLCAPFPSLFWPSAVKCAEAIRLARRSLMYSLQCRHGCGFFGNIGTQRGIPGGGQAWHLVARACSAGTA